MPRKQEPEKGPAALRQVLSIANLLALKGFPTMWAPDAGLAQAKDTTAKIGSTHDIRIKTALMTMTMSTP